MLTSFTPEQRQRLARTRVGIVGCGGLGSNAAMMLARSGVGALILVDGDRVEVSNLNRQHWFPRHIGMTKVEALREQLCELRPDIVVEPHRLWMGEDSLPDLLSKADIWVEAVDDAGTKALFVSAALGAGKTVVSASGMGGFGGRAMTRRILRSSRGLLAVVGDFETDVAQRPPLAPRVMQCAAMEADAVLEFILTGNIEPLL